MTDITRSQLASIGDQLQKEGEKPMARSEVIRRITDSMHISLMRRRQVGKKKGNAAPPQG